MYALNALKRITPPTEGWYNLDSNRILGIPDLDAWGCREVRVCARTPEGVLAFCQRNHIDAPHLYQPAQDVDVLCTEMMTRCLRPSPVSTNLDVFEWNHIRARCWVVRVIDGDTLVAAVTFDPNVLVTQGMVRTPWGVAMDREWTIHLILRLYGVDAAEKNTPEGKECIGLLTSHLNEQEAAPLMATLCGSDKYGRTLAVIQRPDGSFLNSFLVDAGRMCGRPLARAYLGGHKADPFHVEAHRE